MASRRITKRAVDALHCPPERDRVFLWDDSLSGFGVTAFASGTKVYVAQFRQNGRSRRMALGEHGRLTPDQARSEAKKVLGAVETGDDPIQQRRAERAVRSFRETADDYMRLHAALKCKPRTAIEFEGLLRLHILPALGSRRISDIRRVDVARLHASMTQQPGAANRALSLISAIWNWAARRDEVSSHENPARGIERNPEKACERYLTSDELSRLGEALRKAETVGLPWDVDETAPNAKHIPKTNRVRTIDSHAIAAIRLLILTGARLREILTAKWEYVDFERGMMFLPDSKTGKKSIYLSAAALAVLQGIPRIHGNPHIIAGIGPRKLKEGTAEKPREGSPRADLKNPWAAIQGSGIYRRSYSRFAPFLRVYWRGRFTRVAGYRQAVGAFADRDNAPLRSSGC